MYAALYESAAAHSRLGLNVVMDVGHHDAYTTPKGILFDCSQRLTGLPAILVGVRCPLETILQRRSAGQEGREGEYAKASPDDPVPAPVARWQSAVHDPGIYDLEVDTSKASPAQCAEAIRSFLADGHPTALARLAALAPEKLS
jgi:chloramphenicol 3-O phosphotransferase